MQWPRLILASILALLIGVPVLLAPPRQVAPSGDATTLVIFTPHHESIRQEFKRAFEAWHLRTYGTSATVAWATPGGTSEIRKMLEAAFIGALRRGAEPGGQADLLFGGGSYEFTQLARTLEAGGPGSATTTVLAPLPLDAATLAEAYGGRTLIGDTPLYDPKGMWYGAALSGFGIVYNRDLLSELGVPEPTRWADLCDARLVGWVALVNPAQSGSVTTAYEAILQRRGWTDGWRILRRMAANARTFSASAPKAPTDVSLGEAAAGICIDFYGRYQSQAMIDAGDLRADGKPRVGYIDPPGETVIDPDPVAMLRGGPNPELAERFVRFVLSVEGQALWNFEAKVHRSGGSAVADDLGPERHELRRMPIRPSLYADHFDRLIDRVDPYAVATAVESPNRFFRSFLPPTFVAMAIENRSLIREAWLAIIEHPAYPDEPDSGIVTAADVTDPTLKAMLEAFDAMPMIPGPDGESIALADERNLERLRDGWLRGGWKDEELWPADAARTEVLRSIMTAFFRLQYERVLELSAAHGSGGQG
jgi:ABC-type Fe3+ transport system substrate-binding protein